MRHRPFDAASLLFVLLLLASIQPGAARACIGPSHVDLWYLATQSDVIVVGKVIAVRRSPLARFEWLLESAHEALQELERKSRGTLAGDLVMVLNDQLGEGTFPPAILAPSAELRFVAVVEIENALVFDWSFGRIAPTTLHFWFGAGTGFLPGERALVFAKREGLRLETWYSNGAIPVATESELEDLTSAVRSARELRLDSADAPASVEWRVQAARLPGALPHVLGRLGCDELSIEQIRQLSDTFVKRPLIGFQLTELLAAVRCHEDPRIDRLAIAIVEATPDADWLEDRVGELLNMRLRAVDGVCPERVFYCGAASSTVSTWVELPWQEIVSIWYPDGIPEQDLAGLRMAAEPDRSRREELEAKYMATYARWR